jgi:Uma2 family endonuclease
MAEPAIRRMSLDEFLRWDDGTETRYELINGRPKAMAPTLKRQSILSTRLSVTIEWAPASGRRCDVQSCAGLIMGRPADTFFVVDLAATSTLIEAGAPAIKDPFLIVEILSPGTERHDRRVKLPVYRQLDTVQEILLIASDDHYAELHRRAGAQWVTEILRGRDAVIRLDSVGIEIAMVDLYGGIALGEAAEGEP